MSTDNFNAEAGSAHYGYRPSPVHPRGFQILKLTDGHQDRAVPVGDYTVLDSKEDFGLSEKKVMNLISIMNGRKHVLPLGEETGCRVLYHMVSPCDDDGMARILFYSLGREGVSVENAMLRLEGTPNVAN